MQKILRSPASMRRKVTNKLFGVPLKELCRGGSTGIKIPDMLHKIVNFIQMHGIGHEGIFRINGSSKVVDKLKLQFDRYGDASLEEASDVMAVASLLKLFFRELPEAIITVRLHPQFLILQQEFEYNKEESLKQLKNLLQQLPEENYMVLKYMCRFLVKVTHYEDTNKMNSMALAIVFGPNFFRCADGIQGLREQGQTNHLVRLFIERYDFLFGPDDTDIQDDDSVNGQTTWSSKRIEVQAAKEKRSPPITPMPYDTYMKMKKAKQSSQDDMDLNSNYSEPSKDDTDSPQSHGHLGVPDGELADERAFSPFNLDSDVGTSAAPSPVSSSITSELVEKTIQESICQHLFGARGSPDRVRSPRLQDEPVAMPRKKHQKKGQDGSTSFNRRSNSESSLEHLAMRMDGIDHMTVRGRIQQFTDDTMVTATSQEPIRRKGRPSSKAFDIFESQGIILGQKQFNPSQRPSDQASSERVDQNGSWKEERRLEDSALDNVSHKTETLNSLTAGRVAPPRRRSPSKKDSKKSGVQAEPSEEAPSNGKDKLRRTNHSDSKPEFQIGDVWLRQNGRPQANMETESSREAGSWASYMAEPTQELGPTQGPVPQPRQRRRKQKEEEHRRMGGVDMNGDGQERNGSPHAGKQVVPPLDLTSLHEHIEGNDAILARPSHHPSNLGNGNGNEGGSQTLSRLQNINTITSSTKRAENLVDPEDHTAMIKHLTRQIRSLKQKIRQYEEEFERQYNAKPTQSEKMSQPEIKKMIGELKRASKQLKAIKSEAKETKNPLHSTLPARLSSSESAEDSDSSYIHLAGLKESLNLAQKRLQEKRMEANRTFNIPEMTLNEVREEKVAIQKVLLQLESKYGRPTTRSAKEVMKPLYDRYRNLKKLLKKQESRRSISEDVNPSDLNTIEEHVETKEFTPKQMGFVHSKYDDEQEAGEEEDDDLFRTSDFRVTQMVSPGQRSVRSSSDNDDGNMSPNDSGRNESPYSPDVTGLAYHEASLEELVARQDQAVNDKRRLRRILKDFEENFLQETGHRVQKEDRSPMEIEYNEYKHIKKQLKLLNALVAKHQSHTSTAVT